MSTAFKLSTQLLYDCSFPKRILFLLIFFPKPFMNYFPRDVYLLLIESLVLGECVPALGDSLISHRNSFSIPKTRSCSRRSSEKVRHILFLKKKEKKKKKKYNLEICMISFLSDSDIYIIIL